MTRRILLAALVCLCCSGCGNAWSYRGHVGIAIGNFKRGPFVTIQADNVHGFCVAYWPAPDRMPLIAITARQTQVCPDGRMRSLKIFPVEPVK